MNISVVIATHNRRASLKRCIEALRRQTVAAHEVIVVDDASSDGSADMLASEYPWVTVACHERQRGPAAARNLGIVLATGDVVAFTDDDCVPPPTWLASLARGFSEFPGIAGVGGYQEASETQIGSNVVARADHVMRLKSSGAGADQARLGGGELPGLATNNVAYLRAALLAVGGFDETFPVAAGEDTDLKVRISQYARSRANAPAGGPLLYLPLKVRHDRDYSLRAQWRMAVRRGVGAYYFEQKHAQPPGVGRILLRVGVRSVRFLQDVWQQPVSVALVIYLTRIGDCLGQLKMALSGNAIGASRNLRAADSATRDEEQLS